MEENLDHGYLYESLGGLSDFLENRTAMMQAMYSEDVRRDFLLREKLQSLDEVGGPTVQPVKSPYFDLSPLNDMFPNKRQPEVIKNYKYETPEPKIPTESKNEEPNYNMPKFAAGGLIPGMSTMVQDRPESMGLDKVGLDDGIEKNIAQSIESDFKIDDTLKKAFGQSLGLPVKAAAVALVDLMSKLQPSSKESSEVIRDNIQSITSAFKLATTTNRLEASDTETSTYTSPNFLESIISTISNALNFSGGDSLETDITNTNNIGLVGDGGSRGYQQPAPYTGTADGIGLGGNVRGSAFNNTNNNSSYFVNSNVNSTLMGSNSTNNMSLDGNQFNNFLNLGTEIFNGGDLGFEFDSNMLSEIYSGINSYENTMNLSELTNSVIQENRVASQQLTDVSLATARAESGTQLSKGVINNTPSEGTSMAKPDIKQSVYISLYNKTSQF